MSTVSGISAIGGFGYTLAAAKKQDPTSFGKGFVPTRELQETGANLALRALGWGTLYAFTGCGILFYSIWKLSGAKNVGIILIISFNNFESTSFCVLFR